MLRTCALSLIVLVACRDATGKRAEPTSAGSGSSAATGSAVGSGAAAGSGAAVAAGSAAGSDDDSAAAATAQGSDYVPAEYKTGMARWKDIGVYVDGKPVAFLAFGELPIALKPTWVKDKVSINKPANCPACPSWTWSKQRFYRFDEYLKAIGFDLHKIKMLHVYGPKLSQTIAVSSKDLLSPSGKEFMFRFGGEVNGKPIPHVPPNFGNGKQPDKINGVMIYIDRKAPTITRDGIELDGEPQYGVPYYGEPIRGGVRIYLDDKLAAWIKRAELDVKKATKMPDGDYRWSFKDFLAAGGVDMSKIVEGWVIRNDRRQEKIPWSELEKMTFSASAQAKGGVLIGDKNLMANAIALHTRAIAQDEIPVILPDEEW